MEVTPELVDRIAHLARLHFEENEKEEIRADLEKMIGFVDRLRELDLGGTTPLVHPVGEGSGFRDDVSTTPLFAEEAFREAPVRNGPFFTVPKVIRKD